MILKHQHFDLFQTIVLERMVFHPPLKADASMHNEACFLYAVKGNSRLYGPTQSESLNTQEGVVMKCGNYLNAWRPSEPGDTFEAIAVHFTPDVLQAVYGDEIPQFLKTSPSPHPVSIHKVNIDPMIENYVESLIFYFENPSLINEELIKLKVKELILLLINTESSVQIHSILRDLFNPTEHSFKEIIEAHLFEDLSIHDLALLCHLSVSSFKRKFKEAFSESPARYIKLRRLQRAAELLPISKQRITDICYDCGFKDVGHFSKSFAAHFGCSPSEYRERS